MENIVFFAICTIPLLLILYHERKDIKIYLALGIFTVILGIIFEEICAFLGFWSYFSEPKLLYASLLPILMYFHYICFCYFTGNWINRRLKK